MELGPMIGRFGRLCFYKNKYSTAGNIEVEFNLTF